jgi:hypothetical protein
MKREWTINMPPAAFLMAANTMPDAEPRPLHVHMRGLEEHVREYPDVLKKPARLVLSRDTDDQFFVADHDGRHRAYMKMNAGIKEIPVDLVINRAPRPRRPLFVPVMEEWRNESIDSPRFELILAFAPNNIVEYMGMTEDGEYIEPSADMVEHLLRVRNPSKRKIEAQHKRQAKKAAKALQQRLARQLQARLRKKQEQDRRRKAQQLRRKRERARQVRQRAAMATHDNDRSKKKAMSQMLQFDPFTG